MERFRRAVNGKRLFTAEFKREQVARVLRSEPRVERDERSVGEHFEAGLRRWSGLLHG